MPNLPTNKSDFLIIGGGIIGLTLALEAKRRYPSFHVTLIEKEKEIGLHASGRNSGVLHAGFYYTADSLKARFTHEGCKRWKQYCKERGLKLNECGKLVVAKNSSELPGLEELLRRGKLNGVELYEISESEAKKIEPRVKTYQKALYSPTTASVDPKEILESLLQDAKKMGIQVLTDTGYLSKNSHGIFTTQGKISANYIINTAGLYADKIARDFGFSKHYRILPFKGLYLYSSEEPGSVKTNIYPVPDLRNPFLGVHYTLTVDGKIKIGPTAIPAFWREHYHGFKNFKWNEFLEVVGIESKLLLKNSFNFRNLAFNEIKKYSRKTLVGLASTLLHGVEAKHYIKWGKPGIRAQLLDTRTNNLEMDFRFEGDKHSFHVLNAVSPAFTCALPFSEFLWDQISKIRGEGEMEIISLEIPEVKILRPKKIGDHRGFFSETYSKKTLAALGIHLEFVQDNHSLSAEKNTIRGLHFQTSPFAQNKLVRVIRGSILDVAVDLRKNSPTFGKHVKAIIRANEWNQILVPIGFAHGVCTLEPNTELIYKVSNYYSPEHDKGLLWNDPKLGIEWPIKESEAILSDKDKKQPRFSELSSYF